MPTADDRAFVPATRDLVETFAAWEYDPPYDVYNLGADPETIEYMLRPDVNCHAILGDHTVVGYCTYGVDARVPGGDYAADRLDIGMAINPVLIGKGMGRGIAAAVVGFGGARFKASAFRVTIALTNTRANRVWEGLGFIEASRFETERTILNSNRWRILERVDSEAGSP